MGRVSVFVSVCLRLQFTLRLLSVVDVVLELGFG
jgi:hypothetical protein